MLFRESRAQRMCSLSPPRSDELDKYERIEKTDEGVVIYFRDPQIHPRVP